MRVFSLSYSKFAIVIVIVKLNSHGRKVFARPCEYEMGSFILFLNPLMPGGNKKVTHT